MNTIKQRHTLDLDVAGKLKLVKPSHFKRYAAIKATIKELQDEAEAIERQLSAEMEQHQLDKVPSAYGTFFFTLRKKWEYPEYVTEAEDVYKQAKKRAELTGQATCTETKTLSFRQRVELPE